MPSSQNDFTTNTSVSEITEFRVPAGQPAQILFVHTAISRRINLLLPSLCIAGIAIHARCLEVISKESRETVRERDVRHDPLPLDLHPIWTPYAQTTITLDQLEH